MLTMDYFWSEERDIPEGVGFSLFGSGHLAVLALSAVIIFVWVYLYKRAGKGRRPALIITAFLLPCLELWKILFLIRAGRFDIGHLPLHFCSLAIYLYPLYALTQRKIIKTVLGDFFCCVLLPAGIGALLFPDWTMYPLISFMSISSFVWHTVQIILPLCVLFTEEVCADKKSFLYCVILLIIPAVLVYIFDRVFNCNYWFLLYPVPGPPEMIYDRFGADLYLPALAGMVLLVVFITWGIVRMKNNRKGHNLWT